MSATSLAALALALWRLDRRVRRDAGRPLPERQHAVAHGCRSLVEGMGITVHRPALAHTGPVLVVANHVSWLDGLVIHTVLPCCFIAKQSLQGPSLAGRTLSATGALWVDTGSVLGLQALVAQAVDALRLGRNVCVFPEGTTGGREGLLPFHAALFEAAALAGVPVLPLALRYREDRGQPHALHDCPEAAWGDEPLWRAVWRTARLSRRLHVEVLAGPPLPTAGRSRQHLADAAETVVADLLGVPRPARAAPASGEAAEPVPWTPQVQALIQAVAGTLGRPEWDAAQLLRSTWGELGIDSLDAIPVLLAVEAHLGRSLPDEQLALFSADTRVAELVHAVLSGGAPDLEVPHMLTVQPGAA